MAVTCGRCGWQGDEARYCARCGADLGAAPAAPGASFPAPPRSTPRPGVVRASAAMRPAGFWIRVAAAVIDGFVLALVQVALYAAGFILVGGGMGAGTALRGAAHLFGWLVDAAYRIGFHWRWGQTLGKMALQIRVVNVDGGPLSLGQSVGRYFAAILSAIILGIGFLMAGIRSDKRALHDLLAGTRVERI